MNNISDYCKELTVNPTAHKGNSIDVDYVKRLKGSISVITELTNCIEYGTPIKTPSKLNALDKLVIYSNVAPYFTPNRAKYSDIALLISQKNENSIINQLPLEIVHHILKIKSQCGFMSLPVLFDKHYK